MNNELHRRVCYIEKKLKINSTTCTAPKASNSRSSSRSSRGRGSSSSRSSSVEGSSAAWHDAMIHNMKTTNTRDYKKGRFTVHSRIPPSKKNEKKGVGTFSRPGTQLLRNLEARKNELSKMKRSSLPHNPRNARQSTKYHMGMQGSI